MSNPVLSTEAAGAGNYPSRRFNKRERKMCASVADALAASGSTLTSPVIAGGLTASGTATSFLDLSGATLTNAVKFAAGQGATVGALLGSKVVGTDVPSGYVKIVVGTTTYQIPFWAVV